MKDRSTLTFDEWTLLSNIVHAYDEQNTIVQVQKSLEQLSSLPPKIRSKRIDTVYLFSLCFRSIQPFIEHSSDFRNIPKDTRLVLIQNNLNTTGTLNAFFIANETQVLQDHFLFSTCINAHNENSVIKSQKIITRMEPNGTLLKIMLMVLGFSSNCSITQFKHGLDSTILSSSDLNIIGRIQDKFIVLLWKYLVYQFGSDEAVRRLNRLVKNYLDVLLLVSEINSTKCTNIIETAFENTLHSLNLLENT